MHGRHMKKAPKFLVARGIMMAVLVLVLSVSSLATVMANTVSANVIDGDESYSFSMNSTNLSEILAQAEALGLKPLGLLDVAERVENTTTVNVRRGVSLSVSEAGETNNYVAYRGDTLEKALQENNILLKENDQVIPSRDTVIDEKLAVEIRRSCEVTVTADGQSQQLTVVGGTVKNALQMAGVPVTDKDAVNYNVDEPLFEKMNIRVTREMKIKVTVDGKTQEYQVAAETVRAALKKCGLNISEDDILNVERREKLKEGMHITVQRVKVEEVKKTEEIDYATEYVSSEELYENETSVITAGQKGEKELVYKVVWLEGKEQSRELISETTVKEPVTEVVAKGTKERPSASLVSSGSGSVDGLDTFVDMDGNVVPYVRKIVDECTAYSVPGGTTSIGLKAEYGIIAVDPRKIPYGTRMYVVSPDGSVVYGYGVAGDTGGAAMDGDIIADLCYNTVAECSQIGRRDMIVYILPPEE